ncbi:unnamed protein product [Nippostrongylus brasiliensis]|uniref:CCHC-type domain-containing protein n=1 Tax=Nippostrongylus brasiliensis TaxID=27835 RepID=A0A0N4XVX3_NIPBR|nr:unnamed protein product [Nippostrongylus brasiliensis]
MDREAADEPDVRAAVKESRAVFQAVQARKSAESPVCEQLNGADLDEMVYHADFDPVAAAQGRRSQSAYPCGQRFYPAIQRGRTTELSPPTRAASQLTSTPERDQGGSSSAEERLGAMFAAMTLPEVETYKDPQGKNFSDFVLKFRMKYGSLGLHDNMLTHLLLSKLEGHPRAVAQALPKRLREGGFEVLVEALSEKLREDDSSSQLKAYLELKRLRKTGDVSAYCVELERLTRSAYPDQSEEELSRTRAGELVSQLTSWPEYLQLYTAMEIAPKEAAYEMVKSMAQRCERSKHLAEAMREEVEAPERKSPIEQLGQYPVTTRLRPRDDAGDKSVSNVETQRERRQQPAGMKCFNCNRFGHLRKDCLQQNAAPVENKPTEPDKRVKDPKIFTATLNRWMCGTTKADSFHEDLVGAQSTAQVQLLGMTRTALLDTGSQVSIIPLQVFVAARESGFDLDSDVEEIEVDESKRVYDASGNPMAFKGAVKLTLQASNGLKRRIGFFVRPGDDAMIVLGTNALSQLGWVLSPDLCPSKKRSKTLFRDRHTVKPAPANKIAVRQRKSQTSNVATVAGRVYLNPAETKDVSVCCVNTKRDNVLASSNVLLPNTACQEAQHQKQSPVTNSFAGAKIFRDGEVVGTFESAELVESEPLSCEGNMLKRRGASSDVSREEKLLTVVSSKMGDGKQVHAEREWSRSPSGKCDKSSPSPVQRRIPIGHRHYSPRRSYHFRKESYLDNRWRQEKCDRTDEGPRDRRRRDDSRGRGRYDPHERRRDDLRGHRRRNSSKERKRRRSGSRSRYRADSPKRWPKKVKKEARSSESSNDEKAASSPEKRRRASPEGLENPFRRTEVGPHTSFPRRQPELAQMKGPTVQAGG